MIDRGLVVAGTVIPGTDLIHRDPRAWWGWERREDRPDLRSRKGRTVELLTGHWTAGPARSGPDTAYRVVRAMKARKRNDGTLADVSVHLVLGWDGIVWQVADLALATVHAGRSVNLQSIGCECAWPGTEAQAAKIARVLARLKSPAPAPVGPIDVRTVRGRRIRALRPSPELLAGWVALAEMLASLATSHPELGIRIPRVIAATGGKSVPRRGVHEHLDVPGTTKVDAAGYLVDALAAAGWA